MAKRSPAVAMRHLVCRRELNKRFPVTSVCLSAAKAIARSWGPNCEGLCLMLAFPQSGFIKPLQITRS